MPVKTRIARPGSASPTPPGREVAVAKQGEIIPPNKLLTGRNWEELRAHLRALGNRNRNAVTIPASVRHPFQLPEFPPTVQVPEDGKIAMDSALGAANAWAGDLWAGGAFGGQVALASIFAEGQTFMGYPYLAELMQRPEYRVMVETIAGDSTRKWIELTVIDDPEESAEPERDAGADPGEQPEKQDDPDNKPEEEPEDDTAQDAFPSEEKAEGEEEPDPAEGIETKPPGGEEEDPKADAKEARRRKKQARIKELSDELDRLGVRDAFYQWSVCDGAFGRAHLYIAVKGDEAPKERETPIGDGRNDYSKLKVTMGSLKGIKVVEPMWAYPMQYNTTDPTAPNWYKPDQWIVMSTLTHSTRFLTLRTREVPDILKPVYSFGGLSLTQVAKPYVDNWLQTRQSVNEIISSFAVCKLKTNLQTWFQEGGAGLANRAEVFNIMRDNLGLMIVDKDTEDFEISQVSLSTLDALQAQAQEHMACPARIPLVKLLGIQPAGLNASSEGEIITYDDNIAAYQENNFRRPLTTLIHFAMLNIWGEIDEEIGFKFVTLREATPKEEAEIDKLKAEADDLRINGGVIDPGEVRKRVAADADSPYGDIDVEDVPEPPQQEGPGGGPGGEGGEEEGFGGNSPDPGKKGPPIAGDAWNESDHDRAANGQFGAGGAAASALQKAAPALKHFKHVGPKEKRFVGGRERPADPRYHIMASTEVGQAFGKNTPNPVTLPGHETATGVALSVDPRNKRIHFSELNSHIKGAGKAMVEAILKQYPDYKFSVTDLSGISQKDKNAQTFWQKMEGKYPDRFAHDQAMDEEPGAEDAALPFGFDAWSEADHPRGQPGNAGQFGSGGGGGSKKSSEPKQKIQAPQFGMPHGSFTASHGSAPKAAPKSNIGATIDPAKLTKVGGQKGSNPGGVYSDTDGKSFYVKQGKTKDHVRNEMTAAALYDLAGTPTLQYRPVAGGGHIATEMAKLDKDNAHKMSASEKRKAQEDFAVHAWLGNWDAVGLGGDNLGTVNGTPTALDLGGALEYRAQGSPKGKAFGTKVGEINTLRDAGMNSDAAKIFGGMSPAQMRASARFVTSIPDSAIKQTVKAAGSSDKLADQLITRKNDIAAQAKLFGAEGDPKKATSTMVIPADGDMPVKTLNGVAFSDYEAPPDWSRVTGQIPLDEPAMPEVKGKQPASGVIIREPDGRIWMVQPRNQFGGYDATFPKGRAEKGMSLQANAIKEAFEESGLKVKITGHAGDHEGDVTVTRYYFAEREGGNPTKHDKETEGVVLAPVDKAAGFLNRERDRKIIGQDAWEESKHPRAPDGTFGEGSGGGGSGEQQETKQGKQADVEWAAKFSKPAAETKTEGGAPKQAPYGGLYVTTFAAPIDNHNATVKKVLGKPAQIGIHYRRMLATLVKDGPKFGSGEHEIAKLKDLLVEAWQGTYENLVSKGKTKEAGEVAAKLKEMGFDPKAPGGAPVKEKTHAEVELAKMLGEPAPPVPAPKPAAAATPAPAPKPAPAPAAAPAQAFPPPTAAEMEKAKKSVALQLQYVPGAPQGNAQAQKLVDMFNAKWAGEEGLSTAELIDKVNEFKTLTAAMGPLQSETQKQAAEKAKVAAAIQQKKNESAAEALKAAKAVHAEQNKKYMSELGISETEADGFHALVDMLGGNTSDLVSKFKDYQNNAEKLGYPISGFQYALVRNYINGGYTAINAALRAPNLTPSQHVYARMVNNALEKMPKYEGEVTRGTDLPEDVIATYAPGKIVTHRSFTSTGINFKFGGNVSYKIKAIGKRGADFSKGANKSEREVLFKANTMFLVHKVQKIGSVTHIEMEEVEGHG